MQCHRFLGDERYEGPPRPITLSDEVPGVMKTPIRATCPRCNRSFNLTKAGELRKHKCSAAAPLAVEAGNRQICAVTAAADSQLMSAQGTMPMSTPLSILKSGTRRAWNEWYSAEEDYSYEQRRVWSNLSTSLSHVSRDGLEAGFSVSVSTMAQLDGLSLMNANQHDQQFPLTCCGRVLACCSELVDVRKGSVIIGIGDHLLRQPPLEQIPITSDATTWFRDRLRAYQAAGWDQVPVYCHGPVPAAVRQSLQAIESKLNTMDGLPEHCLTREELFLVRQTLMTVTDGSLEAFEANRRIQQQKSAQIRRSRALRDWQAFPPAFPNMDDDDDAVDVDAIENGDGDHVPFSTFVTALDVIADAGWLTKYSVLDGCEGRHFLDEICSLRVVSKAMARALFVLLRHVRAADFRQDRLDPVSIVRLSVGQRASDRRLALQMAHTYAKRYVNRHGSDALAASMHLPLRYQNTPSGDRFCDFVASRFANVSHLEIPILPGTTELGIRVSLLLGCRL